MHVFVETVAAAAEGTGVGRSAGGKGIERPHVDADQLVGGDADEIGEGAIDAKNVVLLVVDDDEVADGIENFQPVAVGLLHAGEEAGILERDAGMAGDGAQQLLIFDGGRDAAIGETKHADQFTRGTGEADQSAIGPSQAGGESGSEDIAGGGEGDIGGIFRQGGTECLTEAAEQRLVPPTSTSDVRRASRWYRSPRSEKDEGNGAGTEQAPRRAERSCE